ncbi:MAG: tetratricopeptide repeat protein [Planctomycetota bacterium]|nr:tetratricopeptide repeat protein [Planctomycetota bacterium]
MPCPSIEEIELYVADDVDDDQRTALEAHISSCASCRTLLAEVEANNRALWEMQSARRRAVVASAAPELARYEITRCIHEGGQGIVYEARQVSTDRPVAIKLLLHGQYASRQQRRRFEREIDLVAHLDHPHIVPVFDSGLTEDDRLFLVMRYVDGMPLNRYIAEQAPPIPRILELFAKIARAVGYAHQRGVIHRDLKPNNILIDADGEPHLLDFGLAKTREDLEDAERSMQTQAGEFIGTLAYAAPEQVSGDPHAVDLRSDVYALGVILFEALTGRHPYPVDGRLAAIVRNILDRAPARPSSIRRDIDGELDAIVGKMLSKEKERRYQNVTGLLRDLANYETGRPLEARGDSTLYVLGKTLRRHRVPVAAACIVFLALIAATVISTVFWRQSVLEERRASIALSQAELEADKASTINTFLLDMLASADPGRQGRDVTVREVLDDAEALLGDSFGNQPRIEVAVRHTIGNTYLTLGLADTAEAQVKRAVDISTDVAGEDDPATLGALGVLGLIYIEQGRFAEAETILLRTLELQRKVIGEEDPRTLATLNNVGLLYDRQGRSEEAEPIWRQTLELRRRILGEEHPETLLSISNLGWLYSGQGRLEEAEALLDSAYELRLRTLGPEHPDTLKAGTTLGHLYNRLGRFEEAEARLEEVYPVQRRVLGEEHPDTLYTLGFLAWAHNKQKEYEEAESLYVEGIELYRRVFGDDHPSTLYMMNDLAVLYSAWERFDKAEPLLVETLEMRRRVLGEENPATLGSMNNLAVLYQQQGRLDEAEKLYQDVLAIRRHVLGAEHPSTLNSLYNIASLREAQGRLDEAEEICRQVLEARMRVLGLVNPATRNAHEFLVSLYWDQERFDEAESLLRSGYEACCAEIGAENEATRRLARRLGDLYEETGRPDEAARYRALASDGAN